MSTKTNCASRGRQDAGHAMPRRLGLLRGDADLLADQPVDERRLADVRPPDDRDVTATETRRGIGLTHVARFREPLSPARTPRTPPPARPRAGSRRRPRRPRARAGMRHSTVKVCAWASPATSVTTYSGTAIRRACSHSCSRVFGSFDSAAGSRSARSVGVDRLDDRRGGSKPRVEEDRAEHGLERVGEDRWTRRAAALLLALAQAHRVADAQRRARAPRACRD